MTRNRLIFAAAAVLLVGLSLGFAPMSAAGVDCGSAFVASDDASAADFLDTMSGNAPRTGILGGVDAMCDDKRSDRGLFAWLILFTAVVLGVGAVLVGQPKPVSAGDPEA